MHDLVFLLYAVNPPSTPSPSLLFMAQRLIFPRCVTLYICASVTSHLLCSSVPHICVPLILCASPSLHLAFSSIPQSTNQSNRRQVAVRCATLPHPVISLSFHPDGTRLAAAAGTMLYMWDFTKDLPPQVAHHRSPF
jgi:hypothetical protein